MSMSCWKALGSPKLDTSATLLKTFNGHMFQPHGIIIALPIELGGKTVSIVVEVIDAPLEYNLLLRCIWFYKMTPIVSSIFRVLRFPHQGKIVMIDQLVFCTPDLGSNAGSNVPFVCDTQQSSLSVVVGMFKDPSLMGIFFPRLAVNIAPINMISSFTSGSLGSVDPWVVPHLKDVESSEASMPLIKVKIVDLEIPSSFVDIGQQLHPHIE
jgi:hypothetical protein